MSLFSNRWSRNNWILPLSKNRFEKLTNDFKAAAEQSFGSPCKMTITVNGKYPSEDRTFKRNYQAIEDISRGDWNHARDLTVNLNPIDLSVKAGQSPWANAKFTKSGKASFYLQPGDDKLPNESTPYWVMRTHNYLGIALKPR